MDQLKKSETLQLLRVGLGDSNLEVRRKSARALISTRLFSKNEVPAIMEAMLAGISNGNELSDTLDAFWTVLTVVESERAKRKVSERLCEFVEGWQSPDDSSEEDEMSEALRFLSFRRREAVGGRKEGTTKPEVPDELIDRLLNSSLPTIRKRAVLLWRRFRASGSSAVHLLQILEEDPEASAIVWSELSTEDLAHPALYEAGMNALTPHSTNLSFPVAFALARVRDEDFRNEIVGRVLALLEQQPTNAAAISFLWNVFGPERWRRIDATPF